MNTQIPIYRAKKIDSNEYDEGSYIEAIQSIIPTKLDFSIKNGKIDIHYSEFNKIKVIDPTTLSIHFPNMLDVEGDKIFASLQEDGKGSDIITDGEYDFVAIFNGRSFDLMFVEDNTFSRFNEWDDWDKFMKKGAKK